MAYPVDKIVKVNEYIQAGGLGFVNFGKATVMALSAELQGGKVWPVKTFKTFTKTDEVGEYFATSTETYKLATRWFAAGGGDLMFYLRDESNDSAVTSANDARGKQWFYHTFWTKDVFSVDADVLALADWGDANKAYQWFGTDDPDVADPNKSDDIASKLLAKGNRHVSVGYRQATTTATDSSQIYCMAGLAAQFSKVNYSGLATAITGEFKSISGVIGEDLSPTEIPSLEAKKVVMFAKVVEGDQSDASVTLNTWSMSSYGEFIDDVINVDAFSSAMRVNLYNVFRAKKKVPMTPHGQAQMISEAENTARAYYDNGALGAGLLSHPVTGEEEYAEFGYKVYTKPEDILTIAEADKRKRKMAAINMRANLARAGHSIVVDLTVE